MSAADYLFNIGIANEYEYFTTKIVNIDNLLDYQKSYYQISIYRSMDSIID